MASDLQSLQARQASLDRSIAALKTDSGMEKELREKFGVVKDGEKLIMLVDQPDTGTDSKKVSEKGFWQGLVDFFNF
jgi:hypothetical protein